MSRRERLFKAILNRISDQGDMHIRLAPLTVRELASANAYPFEILHYEFREVDALFLEILIRRADWE